MKKPGAGDNHTAECLTGVYRVGIGLNRESFSGDLFVEPLG